MKNILLAGVALVALPVAASAADMSYPVKAPVVAAVPVFTWTGFYIGANVGYGGGDFDYPYALSVFGAGIGGDASLNSSGFFGGGQIGYNYQFDGGVVIGVEADFQWSGIDGNLDANATLFDGADALGAAAIDAGSEIDWFGTIRARLGYGWDRALLYVTGGAAYGKVSTSIDAAITDFDTVIGVSGSTDDTQWGWTVGGGLEYALTDNWSFKTEYLYVDLGSQEAFAYNDGVVAASMDVDTKFHTIKAGLNYRF